jgi:hypothetical protein
MSFLLISSTGNNMTFHTVKVGVNHPVGGPGCPRQDRSANA